MVLWMPWARPAHHLRRLRARLDAAKTNFAKERDTGRRKLREVGLDHALFDHRGASQNLDAPADTLRAHVLEGALRRDGERL